MGFLMPGSPGSQRLCRSVGQPVGKEIHHDLPHRRFGIEQPGKNRRGLNQGIGGLVDHRFGGITVSADDDAGINPI